MKMTALIVTPLAIFGAGCSTLPPSVAIASADLPNCFDSNYSEQQRLFTIKGGTGNIVNQQCLLTVSPRGNSLPGRQLTAGTYIVSVSNGGGGGAGGTMQSGSRFPGEDNSGGGGGGGAGAAETKVTINLTEGAYRLTIGGGGQGGSACSGPPNNFGGGPGWAGSPTNVVRIGTGEVVSGTSGAETYARGSRMQHELKSGTPDGSGGFGPGQTSGGHGATIDHSGNVDDVATAGSSKPGRINAPRGGESGKVLAQDTQAGPGGGGGGTRIGAGGTGGGDLPRHVDIPPTRGTLGSGGGGGAGDAYGCAAGARGGHGFIVFVQT